MVSSWKNLLHQSLAVVAITSPALVFSAEGADPGNKRLMKDLEEKWLTPAFEKMKKLTDEQKTKIIEKTEVKFPPDVITNQLEKYNNETKLDIIDFDALNMPADKIRDQFKNLDEKEREETLKTLLTHYFKSPIERQELVNSMIKEFTYSELLENISEKGCASVGKQANPEYVGVVPVVDWLNTAHFNSFFQPTMTNILVNRGVFNEFNSFNQWGLWIEPFGFATDFRQEAEPLKFDLYTVGVGVGGEYTFFERLVLSLGLAYSYSGIQWEKRKDSGNAQTIYLGPSLSYIFPKGFLSCTLLGAANFYHVTRETKLFDEIPKAKHSDIDNTSLDIVGRLEGGLSYTPGGQFFFYPTARVDYLHVFEQGFSEQLEEEVEMKVESLQESFLSTKIGLKMTREFFYENTGFLIPSLSVGWLYFAPLSSESYQYQIGECNPFERQIKVDSWNQYYLGAGFTMVHKIGLLFSLDYEMAFGAVSPLQAGSLRVEWSW